MDKDRPTLLAELQKDIASLLVEKLSREEITLKRASQISQFILEHLPEGMTDEQIYQILPTLDDEFVELASVVHKHLVAWEEKHGPQAIQEVSALIKDSHFDAASKKAHDYFQKKIL